MVYSTSENDKSYSTRLKSTKEKTPKKSSKFKSVDKMSSKYVSLNSDTSKKEMINKSNTLCNESCIETNKIHLKKDNVFQLCELKLSLKRIDENNYKSILSPSSLKLIEDKSQVVKSPKTVPTTPKINSNKSLQRSERHKNDIQKLVKKLLNDTDNEEENNEPNKQSRRISVSSSCFDESDCSTIDSLEPITPKRNLRASISTTPCKLNKIDNNLEFDTPRRIRKSVDHFGDTVDLNEIVIDNSPTKSKHSRRISNNVVNSPESVTPKRERKSVNRFGDSVNLNEMKSSQKTSSSSTCKTNTSSQSMLWNGCDTNEISKLVAELMNSDSDSEEENSKPNKRNLRGSGSTSKSNKKRARKPVDRFGDFVSWNETSLENTSANSKCTKRTSISTSKKSNNMVNSLASFTPEYTQETSTSLSTPCKSSSMMNTFETPKRNRKSVNRFGVSMDSNEVEDTITPRINKKRRNMSINEDDDINFDINVRETPVNKHLRLSMTPTSRSGSKVRRSILQDIPESKEIEVISTPKTPKKTKAHVKNLTASVSRRSDSGIRVPCSPLEKARANLHLHAAPQHLPCREIEFKSIHSYLVRKINDELTGSMYISGVPGTGKTATVKRVIDSLNSDVIMKHSFKFIEINGLRLANPHQAFSVIWKELTTETVSSSRAQALLNDYFSGKKVRELSTILLVDEVDHICNRKQDVVYNILDWPSRTGSKVVVITIANTMDLPERVLRGCVTSRMGLTRLVFKPYSFQQLQEIIMNRLIGNSSFDPDAVQLVARKVAAVSGDARRALDVCRRAIDLIKSEDESQFITINHVNQVLNSIMSGVRVTAIRHCSVLEQIFLKALRDETSRTGFDHSTIDSVYVQMKNICLLEGEELPNDQQVIMMAYRLRDSGLIFLEKKRWDIFRKVSLNVSPEDISYALDKYNI